MNRFTTILFLGLFYCINLLAQETNTDVITLKNGEVYRGEISLKTEDVLMLKTADGKRYQFQMKEIEKTGKETTPPPSETTPNEQNEGNFAGILSANGGVAFAPATHIHTTLITDFSLAFGSRKPFGMNVFLGMGAGYELIFNTGNSESLSYIPVFVQFHIPLNNNKITPAFACKTGYKFALNEKYQGGVFINLSGGINYQLSKRSALYAGIFGQTQRISGTIIEKNELGKFTKQGNTLINSMGLHVAFLF